MVTILRGVAFLLFWLLLGCGQDDCHEISAQFEALKQSISDDKDDADNLERTIYSSTEDDQIPALKIARDKIVIMLNENIDIANSIYDKHRERCGLGN